MSISLALFCFYPKSDLPFADFMLFSLLICANGDFCRTLETRFSFNTFPHSAAYICVWVESALIQKGLSLARHQVLNWTNADLLWITHLKQISISYQSEFKNFHRKNVVCNLPVKLARVNQIGLSWPACVTTALDIWYPKSCVAVEQKCN